MKSYRACACWMGIYCIRGCMFWYACLWVSMMCPVSVHMLWMYIWSYKYHPGDSAELILTLPGCLSDHEGIAPNSGDAPCTTRVHRGFRAFIGMRRHNLWKGETSVRATRHSLLIFLGLEEWNGSIRAKWIEKRNVLLFCFVKRKLKNWWKSPLEWGARRAIWGKRHRIVIPFVRLGARYFFVTSIGSLICDWGMGF